MGVYYRLCFSELVNLKCNVKIFCNVCFCFSVHGVSVLCIKPQSTCRYRGIYYSQGRSIWTSCRQLSLRKPPVSFKWCITHVDQGISPPWNKRYTLLPGQYWHKIIAKFIADLEDVIKEIVGEKTTEYLQGCVRHFQGDIDPRACLWTWNTWGHSPSIARWRVLVPGAFFCSGRAVMKERSSSLLSVVSTWRM